MKEGAKSTFFGLWQIISAIALGIVSLLAYAGRQINAFCRRETIAAAIVGSLIVILTTTLIATFVTERTARVTAEHQRDSIAYKMELYMQAYDTTQAVIVNGDTIKFND